METQFVPPFARPQKRFGVEMHLSQHLVGGWIAGEYLFKLLDLARVPTALGHGLKQFLSALNERDEVDERLWQGQPFVFAPGIPA